MSSSLDKNIVSEEINRSSNVDDLEKIRIKYLGKKGLISLEMKSLSSLSIDEKKSKGQELNLFKLFFDTELKIKKLELKIKN